MKKDLKEKVIEELRKHQSFSLKDGRYAVVGICVREYLANKEIPRRENQGEIEFNKELNELTGNLLELFSLQKQEIVEGVIKIDIPKDSVELGVLRFREKIINLFNNP